LRFRPVVPPGLALIAALAAVPAVAAGIFATPAAPPPPPAEADWRTPDPQNVLVIDTNKGRIFVEMNPTAAPLAVARVRELTKSHLYDGRAFFRVIDDFMAQTGDPKDTGTGGSALPNLALEANFRRSSDIPFTPVTTLGGLDAGFIGSLPVISQSMSLGELTGDHKVTAYGTFCTGVAGMARADDPDTANSQFFLMRHEHPQLDQKYAAWGRVIAGLDVVRNIKPGEPPAPPADQMTKVRLLADMPPGDRPVVKVIDTRSAWFKAMIERVKTDKVVEFSLCDLDLPSQVK